MGRHFGEAAMREDGCGPCRVFALYAVIRVTTEVKSQKVLSPGSRKVPGRTALGTIRSVNLPTVLRASSAGPLTAFKT